MSGAVEGVALLPCPFCGGEAAADSCIGTSRSVYTVGCNNNACEADCHFSGTESYAPLIALWNTRTTPPARSYADEDVARIIDTMLLNADDTAPSEDYRQGVRDTVETYRIAAAIRLLSQGGKA